MGEGVQGAAVAVPDGIVPPASAPAAPEEKVEAELRCKACNKFVTKIFLTVETLGPGGRQKVVKVGFETRCPRCKEFTYHVFVV